MDEDPNPEIAGEGTGSDPAMDPGADPGLDPTMAASPSAPEPEPEPEPPEPEPEPPEPLEDRGLYRVFSHPELTGPVLVMAPDGWIDAGLGGNAAVAALLSAMTTELVAAFDTDELIDLRARRPVSRIVDGVYQSLSWPTIELRSGQDADGHDVLVLTGPEPDMRWRAFSDALAEIASELGVRLLVGLGAFPAPVPHTRTAPLAATASSAELANRIGVVSGVVDVPSGVMAAVERRFLKAGIPAIGIWARVPHYVAGMPYPEASKMLLDGLAEVAGIVVDTTSLVEAAEATRSRLDELTANSVQHTALVSQLEAQFDEDAEGQALASAAGWGDLPSGDELAEEFERYLRDEG